MIKYDTNIILYVGFQEKIMMYCLCFVTLSISAADYFSLIQNNEWNSPLQQLITHISCLKYCKVGNIRGGVIFTIFTIC